MVLNSWLIVGFSIKGDAVWSRFIDLLHEMNQPWGILSSFSPARQYPFTLAWIETSAQTAATLELFPLLIPLLNSFLWPSIAQAIYSCEATSSALSNSLNRRRWNAEMPRIPLRTYGEWVACSRIQSNHVAWISVARCVIWTKWCNSWRSSNCSAGDPVRPANRSLDDKLLLAGDIGRMGSTSTGDW